MGNVGLKGKIWIESFREDWAINPPFLTSKFHIN